MATQPSHTTKASNPQVGELSNRVGKWGKLNSSKEKTKINTKCQTDWDFQWETEVNAKDKK